MEQLSSYWKDLHKIIYFSILQISVENVQVSLKPDKNNGNFTRRHLQSSRAVLLRRRNVSEKFVKKIKTHILRPKIFLENRDVYELMCNNFAEPRRPQMT
jgi:hypothetical protein